jgi:hypothetical protein
MCSRYGILEIWGKEIKEMLREVDRGHHIRRCRETALLIVMVEEVMPSACGETFWSSTTSERCFQDCWAIMGRRRSHVHGFCDVMDLPVPHVLEEHGQHLGLTMDCIFNELNLTSSVILITYFNMLCSRAPRWGYYSVFILSCCLLADTPVWIDKINALTELGIGQLEELSLSCELSGGEFVRKLSVQSAAAVRRLRELLFEIFEGWVSCEW